jgi:lipopolysaccharide transport system permease protein
MASQLESEERATASGQTPAPFGGAAPPVATTQPAPQRVLIRPGAAFSTVALRDLWSYRELLYFLVWRDIKVRYKQTAFGAGWAILQPFLLMVVFTLFLGKLAHLDSRTNGIPYPIFSFAGLVPWTFFSQSLTAASGSLLLNKDLVSKVYFPRLLLPLATAASFVVDLALAMVVLGGMMAYYGIAPGWGIVFLPAFVVLAYLTSISVGIWLTALGINYRDIKYAVPFLVQLWMFLSPVVYPTTLLPERYRFLYSLNPMAGVVEGFRWALLGQSSTVGPLTAVSVAVVLALLAGGVWYFRHTERTFADVV